MGRGRYMPAGVALDSRAIVLPGNIRPTTLSVPTAVVTETLMFGVFSMLVLLPVYLLLRKGLQEVRSKVLLLAIVVMYAVAATHWGTQVDFFFSYLNPRATSLYEIFSTPLHQCVPPALLVINIILSDAIVLWRAWIVWSQNRIVQAISVVLLTSTLALSSVNVQKVCVSTTSTPLKAQLQMAAAFSDNTLGVVAFALSLTTNLWSTCLIGFKAWRHRQLVKDHLRVGNRRTRAEKALALLVESGTIYCLLWVFLVVHSIVNVVTAVEAGSAATAVELQFRNAGDSLVKGALIQLVGIYPTIVITLVCLEQTHCDRQFTYAPSTFEVAEFARPLADVRAGTEVVQDPTRVFFEDTFHSTDNSIVVGEGEKEEGARRV
ncbi:hypothetical protein OF83DRAFT_1169974 [Amylostereum chailletii]|nr:hypothetical protein OF83DRAFT_1169974 [Amylostereum chailletii]